MIEYVLISICFLLGVGYLINKRIKKVIDAHPEATLKEVRVLFIKEEWNTLTSSFLGLITFNVAWFIAHHIGYEIPSWLHEYGGAYGLSAFGGFSWWWLSYAILGTFEKKAEQKFGNGK